jgi:hypothetical protein
MTVNAVRLRLGLLLLVVMLSTSCSRAPSFDILGYRPGSCAWLWAWYSRLRPAGCSCALMLGSRFPY